MVEKVKSATPSIAPSLVELEKNKRVVEDKMSTCPSVTVIAAGGFGTNIIKKNLDSFGDKVSLKIIDTSTSNLTEGVTDADIIAGHGSGKIRKTNFDSINKYIVTKGSENSYSDVNIVLFSMNGGSGSVIAPLIIKELSRLGKIVIGIAVVDLTSQLDVDNTYKTLKSLETICSQNGIYLPMMIFNNEVTRSKVDKAINHRLSLLLKCLIVEIKELDKSDKLNWLTPNKAIGASPGIKGLQVSYMTTGDAAEGSGEMVEVPEGYIFDSIFMITSSQDVQLMTDTRVSYHGILEGEQANIIGRLGFPVSGTLQKKISDTLHRYEAQKMVTEQLQVSSSKKVEEDSSGLCF